jgi:acid phosphatase family membrane protein YuiD
VPVRIHQVELLQQVLYNKMIATPALAWLTAQVLKTLIDGLRNRRLNPHLLVGTGGMPSAHSALVCGLATSAAFSQGVDSPVFAVTVALAAIVMYDAAGVRQAVDRQSEILLHLLTHVPRTHDDFDRFLEGLVGHTRVQVVAGGLLGIAVATLMH